MKRLLLVLVMTGALFVAWLFVPPSVDVQISQLQDQLHRIDQQLEHSSASAETQERLRQERQLLYARMGSLCWHLADADGDCGEEY